MLLRSRRGMTQPLQQRQPSFIFSVALRRRWLPAKKLSYSTQQMIWPGRISNGSSRKEPRRRRRESSVSAPKQGRYSFHSQEEDVSGSVSFAPLVVLPLVIVDNSDFLRSRLTACSTRRVLAS